MQRSENLDLILFEGQDYVKREHFVENFEKLDKGYGNLLKNNSDYVLTTGNVNTYLATLDRALTSYYEGLCLKIKIHVDSTGNCTLNVNGLGAKYIRDSYGNIVTNLKKDIPYHICYNGSDFILLGKGGGGNAQPNHVLENYTFTNDAGPQKGTMKNNGTKIFTPGRSNIALSGYYADGSYIKGDPNFIPENILDTAEIWGIKGKSKKAEHVSGRNTLILPPKSIYNPDIAHHTIDFGFEPSLLLVSCWGWEGKTSTARSVYFYTKDYIVGDNWSTTNPGFGLRAGTYIRNLTLYGTLTGSVLDLHASNSYSFQEEIEYFYVAYR